MIENDAGTHDPCCGGTFAIEHMFDGDAVNPNGDPTVWHSDSSSYQKAQQTLKFTFNQPINFDRLTIKKRRDVEDDEDDQDQQERYKNVCIVLDGNIADKLCTDTLNGGFNGVPNTDRDLITWIKVDFQMTPIVTSSTHSL